MKHIYLGKCYQCVCACSNAVSMLCCTDRDSAVRKQLLAQGMPSSGASSRLVKGSLLPTPSFSSGSAKAAGADNISSSSGGTQPTDVWSALSILNTKTYK